MSRRDIDGEAVALIVSDPLLHANNWVLSPNNNSGVRLSAVIRNSE